MRARAKRAGAGVEPFLAMVRGSGPSGDAFPWTVPALNAFREIRFPAAVTFLMGENGCGKSTLLEALAIAAGAVAAGATGLANDPSFAGSRAFAETLSLSKAPRRPRTRLFFRAEDALGFHRRIQDEMDELERLANAIDEEARTLGDAAGGKRRAAGNLRGERAHLTRGYGDDPHAQSHGEAFARILDLRLVPEGLYFLDEPETPLSPTRVLALLATIRAHARSGSQFVIATHSPILAALPDAAIYLIDGARIARTAYADLESMRVTRDFLNAPERYLRHLDDER